jgi:hypothetical protein
VASQAADDFNLCATGSKEGAIEEFLVTRGFGQVKDMNGELLENIYYKGTNRKAARIQGIVHATVKKRE